MLRKINEGEVEGDSGFSIQITGPECMRYRQGEYFVDIDVASESGKRNIYIYVSKIKNWDQPQYKEITSSERTKIMNNIKEAVKLLTGSFVVV